MVYSNNPQAVGASHCQEGQDEKVYSLEIIPVSLTGGRKHLKKTVKRMYKKSRKNKSRKNKSRKNKSKRRLI